MFFPSVQIENVKLMELQIDKVGGTDKSVIATYLFTFDNLLKLSFDSLSSYIRHFR